MFRVWDLLGILRCKAPATHVFQTAVLSKHTPATPGTATKNVLVMDAIVSTLHPKPPTLNHKPLNRS